jgi:hypothetical protein
VRAHWCGTHRDCLLRDREMSRRSMARSEISGY